MAAYPAVAIDVLERALTPFEFLNVAQLYDRYSVLVDAFIYLLIFLGVAQSTLARHYPGPGGRAVSIGVGLCLTIAMLLAEHAFDFNLTSFGPYAATLVVTVLALMTYLVFRSTGAPQLSSASLAYLILYFSTLAIAPNLLDWIADRSPLVALVAGLGVIASVAGLFSAFTPELLPHGPARGYEGRRDPQRSQRISKAKEEVQAVRKVSRPLAKKNARGTRRLGKDIERIRKELPGTVQKQETGKDTIERLRQSRAKAEALAADVQNLKAVNERLLELDTGLFHEDYQERLRIMTPQKKQVLALELKNQLQKMNVENQIARIETGMEQNLREFLRNANDAETLFSKGETRPAASSLDRSIQTEKRLQEFSRQAKKLEARLLGLAKKEEWLEKHLPGK